MATGVRPAQSFFAPSPLGGEGWGEGPTASLIRNPNTERSA